MYMQIRIAFRVIYFYSISLILIDVIRQNNNFFSSLAGLQPNYFMKFKTIIIIPFFAKFLFFNTFGW